MATDIRDLTVEQFWELAQHPRYGDLQLELRDHRLVTMAPSGNLSSSIGVSIAMRLAQFNNEHKVGILTGADGAYRLDEGTVVAPDVGFVRHDSLPDDFDREKYTPVPPDLAVEVISPTDRPAQIDAKTRRYLAAGTRLVWNVYPRSQTVEVFQLVEGEPAREVRTTADTLSGGAVLPGFTLPVAEIFA